ncbi:hypothetical protein PQJ75_28150, partial [Rhodoplanes sp. TEM]|nr:hypothetical protein [Rhodoplanes sp. TEM]
PLPPPGKTDGPVIDASPPPVVETPTPRAGRAGRRPPSGATPVPEPRPEAKSAAKPESRSEPKVEAKPDSRTEAKAAENVIVLPQPPDIPAPDFVPPSDGPPDVEAAKDEKPPEPVKQERKLFFR